MKPASTSKSKLVLSILGVVASLIAAVVTFAADLSSLWNASSAQSPVPAITQTATGGGSVVAHGNVYTAGQGDGNTSGNNNVISQKFDNSTTNNFNSAPQPEKPSKEQQRKLLELIGVWDSHYCYSNSDNSKLCFSGKMSYLLNGVYNYEGKATLYKSKDDKQLEYGQWVKTAGRWALSGDFLTVENIDMKATPQSLKINGKSYDEVIGAPGINLPRLQDCMVIGQTTQYKVSALDNGRMTAQAFGPGDSQRAELFVVESVKRLGQF